MRSTQPTAAVAPRRRAQRNTLRCGAQARRTGLSPTGAQPSPTIPAWRSDEHYPSMRVARLHIILPCASSAACSYRLAPSLLRNQYYPLSRWPWLPAALIRHGLVREVHALSSSSFASQAIRPTGSLQKSPLANPRMFEMGSWIRRVVAGGVGGRGGGTASFLFTTCRVMPCGSGGVSLPQTLAAACRIRDGGAA